MQKNIVNKITPSYTACVINSWRRLVFVSLYKNLLDQIGFTMISGKDYGLFRQDERRMIH